MTAPFENRKAALKYIVDATIERKTICLYGQSDEILFDLVLEAIRGRGFRVFSIDVRHLESESELADRLALVGNDHWQPGDHAMAEAIRKMSETGPVAVILRNVGSVSDDTKLVPSFVARIRIELERVDHAWKCYLGSDREFALRNVAYPGSPLYMRAIPVEIPNFPQFDRHHPPQDR